jgi:hypothetical protein
LQSEFYGSKGLSDQPKPIAKKGREKRVQKLEKEEREADLRLDMIFHPRRPQE